MRQFVICLTILVTSSLSSTLNELVAAESIDIGTRCELFVDEYLIERMTGARLALHRPLETDDVCVHDTPWEGNRTLYYTIFQDDDIYRMYYRGSEINLDDDNYSIPFDYFII